MNMEMYVSGDFDQQARVHNFTIIHPQRLKFWECDLQCNHFAWRERKRDARRLSVCGGRRVWRILSKAQGNRGRLKRIVMLCPCECLCTSEPLCTQFVHVLTHREKLCGCPSVSMPGFLCICVCLFTFMHLCFHMFLHMSTLHFLCVWFKVTDDHKSLCSVEKMEIKNSAATFVVK